MCMPGNDVVYQARWQRIRDGHYFVVGFAGRQIVRIIKFLAFAARVRSNYDDVSAISAQDCCLTNDRFSERRNLKADGVRRSSHLQSIRRDQADNTDFDASSFNHY